MTHRVGRLYGLFVCGVLLALTGCGATLIYPRLDTLVGLYFDRMVDLNDSQSAQLSAVLRRNLEWHRSSELARYETFLVELADAVGDGARRAEIERALQRAEDYWRAIFEQAAPGYASVAATLTDAQVSKLLAGFEAEDEKEWREYQARDPAERVARREKSLRKTIERFIGPMDAKQRSIVHRYVTTAPSTMPEWRASRRLWREALAAALRNRGNPTVFKQQMRQLVAYPDEFWTPQYRAAIANSREGLTDLLLELDATLSAGQRAALRAELLSLARDVRGLARRPG
jgi:hypothetical protein